jgi:4-hydroxy-tetrahydrodipicolinate synthase
VTVLSGDDSLALAHMAVGARGVISVLANVAPRATADLINFALAGDYTRAREIHLKYFRLMKALFIESNPIPVKAALEMMGKIGPELRMPLTPIGEGARAKLKEAMQGVGLI